MKHKTQEEALREAESKYRSIFENAVEGIFQTALDGHFLMANPAMAHMLGYVSPQELMTDVADVRQLYTDPKEREKLIRLMQTQGVVKGFEIQLQRKDGSKIWISLNSRILRDKEGRIAGLEGMMMDITERRLAEEKLRESEIRYRTLFEQSPDGVLIIDPQTAVAIEFNEVAHRQLGYTRDEFKRLRIFDYEAKEKFEETEDHIVKVLREGREDFETQHRTKDGKIRNVLVTIKTIELSGRTFFHCIFRDLTERRRVEEALRESEMRYRTLFERAGDAIFILEAEGDNAGRIIDANQAAAEMHGCAVDELLSLKISDLDTPDAAQEVPSRIQRILRGEGIKEEIMHHKKDGTVFPVEISGGLLEFGNHKYILSFDRDITERRRAEETLKNYTAKLEEANHLKDLFTDIMRHDLLNPLGIIKIATEQLLVEIRDEKMCNTLLIMKRNADRLIEMIKSASMYAMLESAEKLDRSELYLNEIFKASANNFRPQLDEKNIALEHISEGDCIVKANRMIESVFSNLLSNAIKYSPSGRRIQVKIAGKTELCRICVKDWGYGIKDEDKVKLFTRFQRVDKKGVKGTGLGLAIVKRIVDLHGGRVWIEDNPEGGSVFCVEIPEA